METVLERVAEHGDLFKEVLLKGVFDLTADTALLDRLFKQGDLRSWKR
jgi:hypothetical protein